jgi:putative PIN family toxin of toxin-antitoxin system
VRVVLDNNIWLSGLLWGGQPGKLVNLVEQNQIQPCASAAMLDEFARVLRYKKFQRRIQALQLSMPDIVEAVQSQSIIVKTASGAQAIIQDDPTDDMFLHCAIAARADYIISGDKHLLSLGEYEGVPIVSVHEFLKREFLDT